MVRVQEERQLPPHHHDKAERDLEGFIGYFQSQMALVHNCSDDVSTATFTAGLHTNHSFYRHMVKLISPT